MLSEKTTSHAMGQVNRRGDERNQVLGRESTKERRKAPKLWRAQLLLSEIGR
jgi:hypothetical protein